MESYRVGVLEGPGEFPSYQPDTAGFYKTLSCVEGVERAGYGAAEVTPPLPPPLQRPRARVL